MGIDEIISDKREQILRLAENYGAFNVRIFGSVANGTAEEDNDVDFLLDMQQDRSLFDLGGLQMDLQSLLSRQVDVLTEKGLHWYIREKVLKEARPI